MTKEDKKALFSPFSEDAIIALYKMDPSGRFNEQLYKLRDCLFTIQLHKKKRSRVSGFAEENAYEDVYSKFAIHYNDILDYLNHYDYRASTADDLSKMKSQLNAEIGELCSILEKLHELDIMYERIDDSAEGRVDSLDFWDEAAINVPDRTTLSKPQKGKTLKWTSIIIGTLLAICIGRTCFRQFAPTPSFDISADIKNTGESIDYNSIDMTLPQYYYYTCSQIEPNERNTVLVGPNDNQIVLGRDTLQDLIDMGYSITHGDYEIELKDYSYTVTGFSYDYHDSDYNPLSQFGLDDYYRDYLTPEQRSQLGFLYTPGYGYAVIDSIDGGSFRVSFSSFEKEGGPEMDYTHCVVDGVTFLFYDDETCYPYKYMDIDQSYSLDDIDNYFDSSETAYRAHEDYDDDGINEYHCFDLKTSRNTIFSYARSEPTKKASGYTKFTISYTQ